MASVSVLFFSVILFFMDKICNAIYFRFYTKALQNIDSKNSRQYIAKDSINLTESLPKDSINTLNLATLKKMHFSILGVKYSVSFVAFFLCLYYPIYEGFSAIAMIYSLFDCLSVFCVLLLIFLCFKIFYKDFIESRFYNFTKITTTKAQNFALFTITFLLGFMLYAHTLNISDIDIYHSLPFIHGIIAILALQAIFLAHKIYGILALSSLILSVVINLDFSILEFLICPYLWLFSIFYIIKEILMYIYTLI